MSVVARLRWAMPRVAKGQKFETASGKAPRQPLAPCGGRGATPINSHFDSRLSVQVTALNIRGRCALAEGCAMDESNEYHRNADYCRQIAEGTRNLVDREAWLKLAIKWGRLVEESSATRRKNSPGQS